MNVLLVDAVDFPFGGAHSVHVSLVMQGLVKNDANAFLIIPYGKKREAAVSNKKKYGHFDGIPYYFVKYSRKIKRIFRGFDIFWGVIKTAGLIYKRRKHKKLDAVILGGIVDIIRDSPVIITCAILRIPMYFWLVEKASLIQDDRGIAGFFNTQSQKLTEWLLPKFARGLIVISSNLKKHYLKYLPENRILINPIVVSEDAHKSLNKTSVNDVKAKLEAVYAGKRVLVYSGSFGEKDGVFNLIEAFAEIIKTYPDTVFIMTGRSEEAKSMVKVNEYIKKFDLGDKIKLVGFVNADELLCYNTMADVLFVCRSNSAFAHHGFPWKLGEYCMTEKPIVATNVSDISTYFVNNESLFIVEPNNPDQIAEKVNFIFSDYANAQAVAKKGKQAALKEFGYIEKTKDIVEFITRNNAK